MKVSEKTISAIGKIITGDSKISPYRSGPALVHLFNEYGAYDVYGQGFPSRWSYAEERLRNLNGTHTLTSLIVRALDPREYIETEFDRSAVIDYLNNYIKFDNYEVYVENDFCKIRDLKGGFVTFTSPFQGSEEVNHLFIDEQIKKCESKISEGDFDGAITNARSLVEAVLIELEKQLDNNPPPYDGDLVKLYRRVQRLLNLDPGQKDIADTLKQILSGLNSIVNGLSSIRNKMSDAHARSYRPAKHHAKLAVNAAKTLADFLFETNEYQSTLSKGIVP